MKRSGINDIFDLLRRAAVSRLKFAVPIVADMRNFRYRRLQYDIADLEFGDLAKPNIKEIHCFRAVDFSLSKNLYIFENGVWGVAPRQVAGTPVPVFSPFPWERGQGDRDSKLEVCFQKQTFSTIRIHCFRAVDFLYKR